MLRRAGYFLRKGLGNLRQHIFINIVAVGTIAVSFSLIDSALLVYENLKATLVTWGEKIQVTAYLRDGLGQDQVQNVIRGIRGVPGVREVAYISKDQALKTFREEMKGMEGFFDGLRFNPLPAYCDITLQDDFRTADRVMEIAGVLGRMDGIEDVQYGQEWVGKFSAFLQILRLGGLLVGVALLFAVTFIVSNTIKLSVYARREEIEIMKLVGATNLFVRVPFVIEGGTQGLLGSSLSVALVYAAYRMVLERIGQPVSLALGTGTPLFLPWKTIVLLVAGGTGLGLLGSISSLGRFVKQDGR